MKKIYFQPTCEVVRIEKPLLSQLSNPEQLGNSGGNSVGDNFDAGRDFNGFDDDDE